jgi:hypothetical protein
MIVFDLSCSNEHRFEGWFSSAEDFATQANGGDVCCPVCGSSNVARQLSAPHVSTGKRAPSENSAALSVANSAAMLKEKFIEYVLKNTEDVGSRFPQEARRIHYKEAEERAIRGSASPKDVSALREEGIDVMPVPSLPVAPDKLH